MEEYTIRAHHGMCLAFFEGKGYSDGFIKHMIKIREKLQTNPKVYITQEADDICSACPNYIGSCTTQERVRSYDSHVLQLCGIKPGSRLEWKVYEQLVKEKILDAGKRKEVCGDCSWNELCHAREVVRK